MASSVAVGRSASQNRSQHPRPYHQQQQQQRQRPQLQEQAGTRPSHGLPSASRIEFNNLRSRHRELSRRVVTLRSENRLLKTRRLATDEAIQGFGNDKPRRALAHVSSNHAKDLQFYHEQLNESDRQIVDAENQLHEKV